MKKCVWQKNTQKKISFKKRRRTGEKTGQKIIL